MLTFNANDFYAAVMSLQSGRYRIEGRMKEAKEYGDKPLSKADVDRVPGFLREVKSHVNALGARVTEMAIDELIVAVEGNEKITLKGVAEKLEDIHNRLKHELSLVSLFVLESEHVKFFDALNPFGEDVSDVLPMAIPDIEDAGKCIALNQGTASVFHSMRVMEAALKALAKLLGIPYAPSWESYISQIEKCINEKHKRKTVKWKRDESFFREILGNLQTIKIAWRNPTMHIVRRYSVEEAIDIYGGVRGLLKRLAPRLPKPKV